MSGHDRRSADSLEPLGPMLPSEDLKDLLHQVAGLSTSTAWVQEAAARLQEQRKARQRQLIAAAEHAYSLAAECYVTEKLAAVAAMKAALRILEAEGE